MKGQDGAPDTNRTCDPPLRRGMLYPLSYGGVPLFSHILSHAISSLQTNPAIIGHS